MLLAGCLVDSCFQTVKCRLLFVILNKVSNDPWWLISVVQSATLALIITWVFLFLCSRSFLLSTCLVCCFHVSWFFVKNGGPKNYNHLPLSCGAEHPLEPRSTGLSSDGHLGSSMVVSIWLLFRKASTWVVSSLSNSVSQPSDFFS